MTDSSSDSSRSDEELLALVAAERKRSIGFDHDAELLGQRERALNYYKGDMADVAALPTRSKVVSTDIADAVETVLPDLIEIFTGGDDVAAFRPTNPQDESAARLETDYVNHVVFQENDGFLTLYTMFKDALVEKVGVATWWWGEDVAVDEEQFEGKTAAEVALAANDGEIVDLEAEAAETEQSTLPTFRFTLRRTADRSTVRVASVPPDDFTVAADTVRLADATYCAMRTRPRAQELIAQGIDKAIVDSLPSYGSDKNDAIEQARDTAGEHASSSAAGSFGEGELRTVEIITHFIKLGGTDGCLETWRIVTSANEDVLVEKERVNRIAFAAITPYPIAHRFYGRSLADLLIEVQRIKTVLMRMVLDSGYFALNQRVEVATDRINESTIGDLLRNEPGVPIRSRTGDAVRPVTAGTLSFDVFGALEYFSTVAEGRTGIVRNAQGLNPDTLHDTAKGAMALMNSAQKRVRLIARIFAETGIKDLFLGVHAMLRENATQARQARLSGQWMTVDPTSWAERDDMIIEIGLGASGRDYELAAMGQAAQVMQTIVQEQGGAVGPIVYPANVYAAAKRLFGKLGIKTPELFLTDPARAPQNGQPADKPDPNMQRVLLEHQRESERNAAELAIKRAQMEGELALKRYDIDQRTRVDLANAATNARSPAPLPQTHLGGSL